MPMRTDYFTRMRMVYSSPKKVDGPAYSLRLNLNLKCCLSGAAYFAQDCAIQLAQNILQTSSLTDSA